MRIRTIPLLASMPLFSAYMVLAQTKTLLVDEPLGADPVRIVKVMEGSTELKSDGQRYANKYAWEATFDARDDWLKDLSFDVKNVSDKTIVYLSTGCHLYETADWQAEIAKHQSIPVLGHTVNAIGRRPEDALYSPLLGHKLKPDTRARFQLAPGEDFTINLEDPEDYEALKSSIEEKQPMSSAAACNAGINQIFFEDGTQWHGHRYLREDPEHPGHWIAVSFKEWSSAAKATE